MQFKTNKRTSYLLLCIALIAFAANGQLLLRKHLEAAAGRGNVGFGSDEEHLYGEVGPDGNWPINKTTTNSVDLSPLIPSDCYFPANKWLTYTGYAMAGPATQSAFGFIFYGAQAANGDVTQLPNYPVLVWFNGGPGSSSQFGNFEEMGPLLAFGRGENQADYTFKCNEWTWNRNYNMLFIDNPVGTGLSFAQNYSSIPQNQDEVQQQLYYGLVQMYTNGVLKNFTTTDLIIFGESYAGKYVPAVAQYILQQNSGTPAFRVPLKAIGVGDGFTDPKTIMDTLGSFGFNLGLLDLQERSQAEAFITLGNQNIYRGEWLEAQRKFDDVMGWIGQQSGMQDAYNFQNQETPDPLDLSQFLNASWTKSILNFPQQLKYAQSNNLVYQRLSEDFMKSDCVQRLEYVLQQGLPVLYYNGQNDVIVCTPCTEVWLDRVNYTGNVNGRGEFYNKYFNTWNATIGGVSQVVGYRKESKNLWFYTVNKAGHMVPTDQPIPAYTMVTEWINKVLNKNFTVEAVSRTTVHQQHKTEIIVDM